jgi:hypothetical protein
MFPVRVKTIIILHNSADYLACMISPNLDLIHVDINSMEQSPFWEAKKHSANKFAAFYGILKLITVFTRAKSL